MKASGGGEGARLAEMISAAGRWVGGILGRLRGARLSLGREGERLAERELKRRGYRIVARNFRAAGAEIDLVALDGGTLVFVEVKARRNRRAGAPEAAVDGRKQRRIRRAAEIYAARYRAQGRPIRFDVVAIMAEDGARRIELLRNAF